MILARPRAGALLALALLAVAARAETFVLVQVEPVLVVPASRLEELVEMVAPVFDDGVPVPDGIGVLRVPARPFDLRSPREIPWPSPFDGALARAGGAVLHQPVPIERPPAEPLGDLVGLAPALLIEPLPPPDGVDPAAVMLVVVLGALTVTTFVVRAVVMRRTRRYELSRPGHRGERVVVVYKRRSSRRSREQAAREGAEGDEGGVAATADPPSATS